MNFHERGLSSQAAPLLEKAIEIDPNFAMAYAKLAVVNNNVGLLDKRDEYAKRALSLIDRLTTRERYYIEGFYYGLRPETRGRSIEAYQQGLKLHPEHQASRHNLGLHFLNLERFPEGIAQYEELLRRGTSTATSYENLAEMLVETGDGRRALEVADDYVRRYPDIATGLPDAWHGPRRQTDASTTRGPPSRNPRRSIRRISGRGSARGPSRFCSSGGPTSRR